MRYERFAYPCERRLGRLEVITCFDDLLLLGWAVNICIVKFRGREFWEGTSGFPTFERSLY